MKIFRRFFARLICGGFVSLGGSWPSTAAITSQSPTPLEEARQAVVSLYISKSRFDPSTHKRKEILSWGSGVVVRLNRSPKKILILTSAHVVQDAKKVEVAFYDGTLYQGQILRSSVLIDLALLEVRSVVPPSTRKLALEAKEELRAGEEIFAVGNLWGFSQSITKGVVSSPKRFLPANAAPLIQTDITLGAGSSGSALLNDKAQLVGLVTAVFDERGSRCLGGVGFAVNLQTIGAFLGILQHRKYAALPR